MSNENSTEQPPDSSDPNYNKKFTSWLKSRQGGKLSHNPKKLQAVQRGEDPIGLTEYPPLNADPRFMVGNFRTLKDKFRGTPLALPKEWNNFTGDDWKYKNTVRPLNQGACGSCFAISTASAITDAFVFSKGFKPDISPMYILSCGANNAKCAGGNPMLSLQDIANNGIATVHCLDYDSICKKNPYCNGKMKGDVNDPNGMIPSCGCCKVKNEKHYKFFVEENPYVAYETSEISDAHVNGIQVIKEHLFQYGTAIAGFMVKANLVKDTSTGKFELTKGVYIETENYSGNSSDVNEIIGGHAVCVVGWGEEENVTVPSSGVTYSRMPYWLIRNSWGEKWGSGGYFKYAMYQPPSTGKPPINEKSAFDRMHQGGWGGIILFNPTTFKEFDPPQSSCNVENEIYSSEPLPTLQNNTASVSASEQPSSDDSTSDSWAWVSTILIVTLIVFLIFLVYNK